MTPEAKTLDQAVAIMARLRTTWGEGYKGGPADEDDFDAAWGEMCGFLDAIRESKAST